MTLRAWRHARHARSAPRGQAGDLAGLPANPRISPIVEAWKGVGKYAGLSVMAFAAAAGAIHYMLQGPNTVTEQDEDQADRLAEGGKE